MSTKNKFAALKLKRPRFSGQRLGIAKFEVFATVAAFGIAACLLLPAVHAARSKANYERSQDNLRKIGAAALEHVNAKSRFPFGTYHDNNAAGGSAHPDYHMFYSGFVAILPYLNESEMFERYDAKLSPDNDSDDNADGWSNKKITETRLPVFIDPAMPVPEAPFNPGWSSYAWSGGNNDHERLNGGNLTGGAGGWHDGAIVNAKQGAVRRENVEDGLTNTILAGEAHYTLVGMVHSDRDKAIAGKPNTGNCIWGRGHYPRGFLSTNTALNTHQSKHSNPNLEDWYLQGAFGFRSSHVGGVNFVFCDGSVRFVSDKAPLSLVKALGSRSGGELIAADDYFEVSNSDETK